MEKHMATGRGAIRQLSRRSTLHMLEGGQDPLAPKPVAPAVVAPVAPPVAPNAADNAMMAANLRDGIGAYNSTSYGAAPAAPAAATQAAPAVAPVVAPAKPIGDPGFSSGYMAEQAARNARVGQQPAQLGGSAAARAFGSSATGFSMAPPKVPAAAIAPAAPAAAPVAPAVAATPPAVAPVAAPVAAAGAVKPPTAPGPQDLLTFQNGGMFSSIKRALGMGPVETVSEKYARQDAERAAKAKPATAPPTAPAASAPNQGISNYVGNPVLDARMKAAGLKHGGQLKTGAGGAVPGKGQGDKINAKYEPGEFVVSNDMLDMAPGLREELHALRTHALAKKGMTPQMADAKAVHKGAIRALNGLGQDEEQRRLLAPPVAAAPVEGPDGYLPGESIGARAARRLSGVGDGVISGLKAVGKVANLGAPGAATGMPLNNPIAGAGRGAVPVGAPVGINEPAPSTIIAQANAAQAPPAQAAVPAGAVSRPAGDATLPGQDPARPVAPANQDGKITRIGNSFSGVNVGSAAPTGAVTPGMSQTVIDQTLTNPDGSRWSAQDNATMAANLRDGIDPYTGTSRQQTSSAPAAFDPSGAVRQLNDITSPEYEAMRRLKMEANGGRKFGETGRGARARAQGAIAQMADLQGELLTGARQQANAQMTDATTRRGQDQTAVQQGAISKLARERLGLDKTKAAQEGEGAKLDQKSKQQLMDAQQEYLNAGDDPVKLKAAERKLITLGGKQPNDKGQIISLPDTLGDQGQVIRGGQAVLTPDGRIVRPSQTTVPDAATAKAQALAALKANPANKDEINKRLAAAGYQPI